MAILSQCFWVNSCNTRTPANEFSGSKFIDVNMLVMCPSGRIRTEAEFEELFKSAGFKLTKIYPTQLEGSIIEGVKIDIN